MGAVGADALLDLERELARGDDDQDADRRAGRGGRGPGDWPGRVGPVAPDVGDRGEVPGDAVACRSWIIGSTKAAVLPVPVWAPASRSRPARTSGIASRCTGVGSV